MKINFIFIAGGAIIGVVASYVLIFIRSDTDLTSTNVITLMTLFFQGSSTTCKLTSFYEMYGAKVPHSYPFFLDQLIAGVLSFFKGTMGAGQSLELLDYRSSLGHNLVYYINPNYYLGGNSTGTAWVTECYEFGIIGVIIGAFVLSWFMKFLNSRMMYNRYTSFFVYSMFSMLILSPRGNIFIGISELIKVSITVSILIYTYRFIFSKPRKRRTSK